MREILWSEDALAEFERIVAYIAHDNRSAARRVAERIERAIEALAHMSTGRPARVAGSYEKVVSGIPYIVAHAVGPAPGGRDSITVLRIIHTATNWPEGGWPQD